MINKTKILFITHSSAATGGAEDDFERLLKYFSAKKKSYSIHSIFPKGDRSEIYASYSDRWTNYRYGWFPFSYDGFIFYIKYIIKFFYQLKVILKFTKNQNYDLCVMNIGPLLWPILILGIYKKQKIVVFVRETIKPDFIRKIIYKIYRKYVSAFITVSDFNSSDIKNIVAPVLVYTVYSAVEDETKLVTDDDIISAIGIRNLQLLKNNSIPKCLNVGGISGIKNQLLILQAAKVLKQILKHEQMPVFIFIGENKYYSKYANKLRKYIDDNNLNEFVVFLGHLNRDITNKVMTYCDSVLISSISEGLPMVMVEALKLSVPLISTKVGGVPDIIEHGKNGLLIDYTPESLANELVKLMRSQTLREIIVHNGRLTYGEKFILEKNMRVVENIFYSVILE